MNRWIHSILYPSELLHITTQAPYGLQGWEATSGRFRLEARLISKLLDYMRDIGEKGCECFMLDRAGHVLRIPACTHRV